MESARKGYTIIAGIIFSILWPSASTATKFGLGVAQPFVLFVSRFLFAGVLMLFIAHVVLRQKLPPAASWKKLAVYGLLNISLYLGIYVVAMQFSSAGIGSLFIATNPIFIGLISAVWLKQPVNKLTIVSLFVCSAGIVVAALPLIEKSYVSPLGLVLLLLAMLSYSVSALYFSRQQWHNMHTLTINGWSTLFGAVFLLPALLITLKPSDNLISTDFILSVLWLGIAVSIAAVAAMVIPIKRRPGESFILVIPLPCIRIYTGRRIHARAFKPLYACWGNARARGPLPGSAC